MYKLYKNFLKNEALKVIADIQKNIPEDPLGVNDHAIALQDRVEVINNIVAILDSLHIDQLDTFSQFLRDANDDIQNAPEYIRASTEIYIQLIMNFEDEERDTNFEPHNNDNQSDLPIASPIENNNPTMWGRINNFFGTIIGALFGNHARIAIDNYEEQNIERPTEQNEHSCREKSDRTTSRTKKTSEQDELSYDNEDDSYISMLPLAEAGNQQYDAYQVYRDLGEHSFIRSFSPVVGDVIEEFSSLGNFFH